MEISVNVVTSLLEEKEKVSDKTIQIETRITVSSKGSNEDRLVLLALEKADDQNTDEFRDQRSRHGSLQIEGLGGHLQLVETRSIRTSVILKTSSARRVLYLKVKALKEQEELQARL